MKTKSRIMLLVCVVAILIVGVIYIYYRSIPPKGKAIGIVELPIVVEKGIDKFFRLADINNDKLAEIIFIKKYDSGITKIFLLDDNGNLFNGWPQDGIYPAIGDVNNDGSKEIVDIIGNKIFVYDQSGAQLVGFPLTLENQSATLPILSDLDEDGNLDIIWASTQPVPTINIINGNGYPLEGWPEEITMPSQTAASLAFAVGDIDNDEKIEIILLTFDRLFVLNNRGEIIARSLELGLPENGVRFIFLADFNLDEILEIVLVYGNTVCTRNIDEEMFTPLHPSLTGRGVTGFSIRMEENIQSTILGDLDGDSLPEIVLLMPDQKVYVYDNKGTLIEGWPIGNVVGYPIIGDINSDGINELIAVTNPFDEFQISSYDIKGVPINGWPISVNYQINSTLALADIDDDRLIEIVFADTEDNIHIIKTAGIVSTGTWPEPLGNIYNDEVWQNWYMLIDVERGITNKEEVLSEASVLIPEFIKPEFKILVSGKELETITPPEEVTPPELEPKVKKGKPDVGILPMPANLALTAYIEASSEYSEQYRVKNISDGLLGQWDEGEWASCGEKTPWIKLIWDSPQTINTIVLYDRPNRFDEVLNARIDFSDGSAIITGMLPNSGSPKKIIFNDKNVNWIRLQILEGSGSLNAGLAEIEVFYDKPVDRELNIATKARIAASSEYSSTYRAVNITDGLLGQWDEGEWASRGERTPWIELSWDTPQIINTVVLYDRPNRFDEVLNARIDFSDGSSIITGMLPNSGSLKKIIFNDKVVNWIRLHILEGSGSMNAGLAEIEVYYSEERENVCNLARTAKVSASSTFSPKYEPTKATDGLLGQWDAGEWASRGEQTPWIKLSWDTPQTADMVLLYDRPNKFDEVLNARLEFSDGSSIVTGMLPNSGAPKQIIFNRKTFDWVRLQILEGSGSMNAGLAEFEVFYSKEVLKSQKEAREKNALVEYEISRLKNMDPSLIYTITDPKIVDGKLISYTCQVTNSIGTIKRTVYVEISYDKEGYETGWNEYGFIEDGRLQYREALTDEAGNRIIWFAEAISQKDTMEETVSALKQLAKQAKEEKDRQALIDKELAKLKNMDPALIYTIIDPEFADGKLVRYTCLVTNSLGTIKRTVYAEIFYNETGEEIGWSEYGLMEDGRPQYRMARTNKDGNRQIFFAEAISYNDAMLLKEIARASLIGKDKFPIGIHYILMYASGANMVLGEKVTEEEKKLAIDTEVSKLKEMDPVLIYTITEPKFLKGKLISYTCQVTNSLGTINRTVYGEIYYDEAGGEIEFAEYGEIEDGRIQYRLAMTNVDGNRQIIFAKAFEYKDASLLRELARSALRGITPEDIGLLYIPMPISIQLEDKMPEEWKKLLIDKEISKLKNMDPALIYTITEPEFMDWRLTSYKCQVTNSLGTINRTVHGHIYYNKSGAEIGYAEYGKTEDGKIQYRLARTNKDGNRNIFFVKAMEEVRGFETTMAILKKMMGKEMSDKELIYTLLLTYSGDLPMPKLEINDFTYQLQNIDLDAIGKTKFDLVIIDYSKDKQQPEPSIPPSAKPKHIPINFPIHVYQDNIDRNRFTPEEITALKNSPGGPKIVLAYMSIGEAGNYRWYWKDKWDVDNDGNPDKGAPSWLGSENPDWHGNYKVKYWEPAWQSIIYGSPTSYLDKVIEAGFDGVYLDSVNAYKYWSPDRLTAEQEMADFVKAIACYTCVIKGKTDFLIVPQNGEALSSHPDYLQVVDGIGKEETWNDAITNLDVFKYAKKFVLVIDYVTRQDLIDDFYAKALEKGYVPYATNRKLDVLTINPGHEPD